MISVTQNDNMVYCESPAEQAIVAEEGTVAGPMLRAVNLVADNLVADNLVADNLVAVNLVVNAIADEFPHVLVDTFAYLSTLEAPRVTKPSPNVVVRICIASCNFAAPYSDPVNKNLFSNITRWGNISKHISGEQHCACAKSSRDALIYSLLTRRSRLQSGTT